jgi:uncharacterized membrane-anchored protein
LTQRARGVVLLAIQLVLVLSIAAKYVYERKTCPRVWVRTAQIDPNLVLRGRYLALRLALDACALPHDPANLIGPSSTGWWRWRVKPEAKEGRLVAVPVGDNVRPELIQELVLLPNQPCNRAVLQDQADYFIDDKAKSPFPLKSNEELWVEVTVPPSGPPRPIQLAISNNAGFKPLVIR